LRLDSGRIHRLSVCSIDYAVMERTSAGADGPADIG